VTPTSFPGSGSGGLLGVLFFVAAAALPACGSKEDLVIGRNDFVPLRRDEFDSLDPEFWELATHTFQHNYAWFSPANARVENGMLLLSITNDMAPSEPLPGEIPKAFSAAEVRTRQSFLYGRFRTRARFAAGSAIVTSFWGFYDRYAMGTGVEADNQIVIEGGNAPEHLLRYTVVAPSPAVTTNENPAFDPSAEFHELGYDWTPDEVRFYMDGEMRAVVTGAAAEALTQSQRLLMSAYPRENGWQGTFDAGILPVVAAYDWVEISTYAP
jgi:beta-glucanase (GH16 family)